MTKKKSEPEEEITLREAIKEIAQQLGKPFTIDDMVRDVQVKYPNKWKESAVKAHINALNTKASKAIKKWQASLNKNAFLVKIQKGPDKGKFSMVNT